ncbi:signal recognition particle protein [Candidatus Phycosocius bacilliformis]|uniref:Signal recognition particle protein n=1 Tax=Candidatus Phycosocius bacilliformis TaxID=1445552 RepID=A0A2P2E9W1_9PROT|nr:signal recognition particle protein [Candidatus Phycosocius bacilliformis]GBF57857.1 signal recognition particle protein [Candidatus Phycosocius bacilliformis]
MFDALTERLTGVFDTLTGRGALSEKDVETALREVRVALLEADVALPVVKAFIAKVKEEAVGERVIRAVKPGQQVVKIVYDALVDTLGGSDGPVDLSLNQGPPAVIMMAGLQGSGKTTTTAKLALRLRTRQRKKVLVASLDVRRPAAMEQLAVLATQAEVDSLPIIAGQLPAEIARRAITAGRLGGYDVVFLDTAGRTSIDEDMMTEAAEIARIANPVETLLVADSLTGQDAVETARRFHERLPLTGIVLTRADGDGRGGAALSMRAVTGLPIKFLGIGEKIDGLDAFDASRIAGRILGQGDVVSLVERAVESVKQDEAEKLAAKMAKGKFDLDDLATQLRQIQAMGGLGGVMGMLPGAQAAKKAMESGAVSDKTVKRQIAIIQSMTKQERAKPDVLNASRRKRIAAGAGVDVSEVNKVLKMHRSMADMVKAMGKGGMKGLMGKMGGMFGGKMPPMDPAALQRLGQKAAGTGQGLPGLPGQGPQQGLPGLGTTQNPGGFTGLPGLPFGKK